MRINQSTLIIIGIGILLVVALFMPWQKKEKLDLSFEKEATLHVLSPEDEERTAIAVEFADTPEEIDQGLQHRESLGKDRGMLFIMEEEEVQSFWMIDMLFPIDIIYIDEEKEVVYIAKSVETDLTEPVPSLAPSKYVLQVNAGLCDTYGISVGDRVEWP